MTNDGSDDQMGGERALFAAYNLAAELAECCNRLRATNSPSAKCSLSEVINTLMTELWDQRFSQTEIREAFTAALDDMNRYAAGQERR